MDEVKRPKLSIPAAGLYPVLSDQLVQNTPLTEVYIAKITNVKAISKIIPELNTILPLPELAHLKRVKGQEIILCPVKNNDIPAIKTKLENRKFDVSLLNNISKASVAELPPLIKSHHVVVHKLWPCNFHPDKYLEKLCTNNLFTSQEIDIHEKYMQLAYDVACFARKQYFIKDQIGTVVFDPKITSVVAIGYRTGGPCQHSVMVAIENVSKTQNPDDSILSKAEDKLNMKGFPSDMLDFLRIKYGDICFGARIFKKKDHLIDPSEGPYLCTSYYVYVTHEPCVMCAMALVHSRVKRVFYGTKSSNGGLGTLCKIHTVKSLNHHYEVFGGLLEDVCKGL